MKFFRIALATVFAATGEVQGNTVHYRAEGRWTLGGGFLELWMIEDQTPPTYEASVYIGHSDKHADYVAHWLDVFGADAARVVGFGKADGDALVIEFPYAEAQFRNRYEFAPDGESFTLKIDSRAGKAGWEDFASLVFRRVD